MVREVTIDIEEVLQHFSTLEDPRSTINRQHSLPHVVVMAIMAILGGATGPTSIAKWVKLKSESLKKLLSLPKEVPRKDVFRRLLMALKPEAFQACFVHWLNVLREAAAEKTAVERPTYAVDGKTLRRSHDRKHDLGALHSVTVYASEFGLTLAQVATEEKSNEITAIPELLKLVDIKGAIITIDAMGTQREIAQQIVARGGDYVLALKANQEKLCAGVVEYIQQQSETDFADCGARQHTTTETGHGREETRHYIQMPAPKTLPGFTNWAGLLTIGMVALHCIRNGKETSEIRYFISSLALGVKTFARAVRAHWGIENTCHWSLDVTYREDESRIREKHLRENFAWLNRFTLSLLKQHPGKGSLAKKRRACGWSDKALIETLTGITT